MSKIYFSIDQTPEGHFQLAINDESGGYRICGPKYDGRSKTVKKHELSARDVAEIGQYFTKIDVKS